MPRSGVVLFVVLGLVSRLSLAQAPAASEPAAVPSPSSPAAPPPPTAEQLEVKGNLVLPASVYRVVAWQGGAPGMDAAGAAVVEKRVKDFLVASGFVLARVAVQPAPGKLLLEVDEGRLSRVIVHGQGAVGTLEAKLMLTPEEDVFNRLKLEETLQALREGAGVLGYRYTITQPEGGESLLGLPLSEPTGQELHVYLTGPDWETGVSVEGSVSIESLRLGGLYRGEGALLEKDRWQAGLTLGADYFHDLERGTGGAMQPSYGRLTGRWLTPPLGVHYLRAAIDAEELLVRRQRSDLGVTSYRWNELQGSTLLELQLGELITVHGGLGLRHRWLFDVEQPLRAANQAQIEELSEVDAFWRAGARVSLNPGTQRIDRRHNVAVDTRASISGRGPWAGVLAYNGIVGFGWDDLAFAATAAAVGGDLTIAEAIPLSSRQLRGVFGQDYYMDRVVAVSSELHLAVARDLLKVGGFVDLTGFRESRTRFANAPVRVGLAAGPGIFALLFDAFQLNVYYSFGVVSDLRFDHNVFVQLEKAY